MLFSTTKDKYQDVIVSAISSVVPEKLSPNEILITPDSINDLRIKSVIKVDRIVTLKKENVIAELGKLTDRNKSL